MTTRSGRSPRQRGLSPERAVERAQVALGMLSAQQLIEFGRLVSQAVVGLAVGAETRPIVERWWRSLRGTARSPICAEP